MNDINAIEIDSLEKLAHPRYSICTLLTDKAQYRDALASFREAGFTEPETEFLYIDNTESNKYDAYAGVNLFLRKSRGDYIILCHQDLVLHADNKARLDQIIDEINRFDKDWALLGNAGGTVPGQQAYHLTEYTGEDKHYLRRGSFPAKAYSLDENFIVVRKSANLSVSHDLKGFHLYGTDICMIARILGYSAYVVDFHLWHLGGASTRPPATRGAHATSTFDQTKHNLISKYQRVLSPRFIQTTCTIFYVSASRFKNFLLNRKQVFSIQKRLNSWRNSTDGVL
jgi:hypothetical protein